MKLEIESQEELEAASRAIEEYRKSRVRHVGAHAKRMDYACHQSVRERAFADKWQETNAPPSWLNGGRGTLEWLVCTDDRQVFIRDLTPAEATAAASAIQWLGTNCGWCWLCEAIKKAGYTEPQWIRDGGTK